MSQKTASSTKTSPSLPKVRILIVEDDPLMQLGLEQAFADISHLEIIGQAEDGYLGIQAALQLKPDLVIMDIG
ncbi:Two-component response regulator (fragment) [Hyella patelloides LEGE 07179]|uniref:Two-component response regulator n=1 Tax=Hyella patelloides LEGE 07179 TaxID=945734 RepID=A0A563VWL1_9CYAN